MKAAIPAGHGGLARAMATLLAATLLSGCGWWHRHEQAKHDAEQVAASKALAPVALYAPDCNYDYVALFGGTAFAASELIELETKACREIPAGIQRQLRTAGQGVRLLKLLPSGEDIAIAGGTDHLGAKALEARVSRTAETGMHYRAIISPVYGAAVPGKSKILVVPAVTVAVYDIPSGHFLGSTVVADADPAKIVSKITAGLVGPRCLPADKYDDDDDGHCVTFPLVRSGSWWRVWETTNMKGGG